MGDKLGEDLAVYNKSSNTSLQDDLAFLDIKNTCPRTGGQSYTA